MSAAHGVPADGPDAPEDHGSRLARANINPATGLATDYLNHFNEAIMLLEMMADCPECGDDFRAWRPLSYREHFAQPQYKDRRIAIEAYDTADPTARHYLDTLADAMTAMLERTRKALANDLPPRAAARLSLRTAAWLRPLVARAAAVINGETEADGMVNPQAAIDRLMQRWTP